MPLILLVLVFHKEPPKQGGIHDQPEAWEGSVSFGPMELAVFSYSLQVVDP